MLRPLLCLSLFTCYVSAVAFSAPRTTSCAETGDLLNPPEPTEGPRKPPVELLRRDATTVDLVAPDNTCGFISGLAGAAYYCLSANEKCAFLPGTSSTPGVVACCNTLNCGARVTCIDQVAFSSGVCQNGCIKDTFTLKCTASSAPYCNGITFVDANVRDYFCDSITISTWQTASTTYNGEKDGRVFSSLTITPSASTTSASSEAPSTTSSSSVAEEGGAAASSPASTFTSAPASGGSSTPIGPIVGGVVGGVGGIALIGLIVFLIVRHNTKKKNDAANANTETAPPDYIPPQDPNNSAYTAAAAAGKPAPTAQDQALQGHWAPAPMESQYTSPQMQQGPYQPVHQQQYPPMAEMQGNMYHPQQSSLAPASYYPANQSPGQTQAHPGSPGQVSQNSGHLSSAYPDNNDMTSHMSNRRSELLGSEAPGTQGPSPIHSPTPTFATMGTVASPAAGGAVVPHTQTTEGRSEMSANMAGGPYPSNLHDGTYEVPGDVGYHG